MAIADIAINIITKGATLAKKQLNDLGNSGKTSATNLKQLGNIMAGAVAVSAIALAKGVSMALREFTAFDEAMNQSLAIMKTSEEQQLAMAEATKKVAMETRIGTKQSAEAYFFLASAGLSAEQSINALPQVAKFAQAGMFDMATATDLATDAQSGLGLTVKDAQQNLSNLTRVTDVLVKANTLANASVQQFSEALTTKAGAALKVANKDIEEGVAVLAVFADAGVKGAEAGDKLNQVLRDIIRANENNKEAFKALGLEIFKADGNMKNLADVVEELDRVMGPMNDAQKAATLDQLGLNRGVADAVKILSGSTEKIREYESALRDSAGITDEIANNQLKSLQAELDILNNKWEILLQDIGKDFEGTARGTVGLLDKLITKIIEVREAADIRENVLGVQAWRTYTTTIGFTEVQTRKLITITKDLTNTHDAERDSVEAYNSALEDLRPTKQEIIEATEEEIEKEKELAKERRENSLGALNKVLSAYKKLQAIKDNIIDLESDEKDKLEKLTKAKSKEKGLISQRDFALQQLLKAQEQSKIVTIEEELAIIKASQAMEEAKKNLDGTREAQLEYEIAQKRVNDVIAESTSATQDEIQAKNEYQRSLDELERQMEKIEKAQKDYQDAQENLAKATARTAENLLEQAIAKKELDKALADANAINALEIGLEEMVKNISGSLSGLREEFEKIFALGNKPITMDNIPSTDTTQSKLADTDGSVNYETDGSTDTTKSLADRLAFTKGQTGGVTTINNIQVSVEGALAENQTIQDAVAIAVLEAQKRGTRVIL